MEQMLMQFQTHLVEVQMWDKILLLAVTATFSYGMILLLGRKKKK